MAGHTAPAVFGRLPEGLVELVPMYFELDGTFPHHEANPIEPANLRDLQDRVVREGADLGLAFDGDADRCFLVDERGAAVSPSALTALIASRELAKEPGATVIHNLITSRAVPELVRELGGVPVRTRVGHSFIKATMAETDAIFGGEHSGHFYFRDFWRADSGMLAALHALAALSETDRPLSELMAEFDPYPLSGEINSEVADTGRGHRGGRRGVRRPGRRHRRPARRADRQPRRLDLQRATLQHRAAAAAQRRGPRPRHHGAGARRCARADPEGPSERPLMPLNLSDELLAIIVCPDCHGDLAPVETEPTAASWSARPAAWPTRSATTSRCCSSTKPVDPAEPAPGGHLVRRVPARRRVRAGRLTTSRLRTLAESGARVRREAGEAAAAIEEAVARAREQARPRTVIAAGPDSRLLRAVLEPWCPVPFVAWPGPALPGWAGSLDLVVVLAPDGSDTGTASAVAEAIRRGCQVVVACPPASMVAEHAAGRWSTILPTVTRDQLATAVVMLAYLDRVQLGPAAQAPFCQPSIRHRDPQNQH